MKSFLVIQEVVTGEYYMLDRLNSFWVDSIEDATRFDDQASIDREIRLHDEWDSDFFKGRYIEIKEIRLDTL